MSLNRPVAKQNRSSPVKRNLIGLLRQFTSPIVLILIVATVISMIVGDVIDGVIILAILIPSGLLSFYQEFRADKTMQSLLARIEQEVEVMRDGKLLKISTSAIEIGDQISLKAG
jgi:Mg2+-importing ATPase